MTLGDMKCSDYVINPVDAANYLIQLYYRTDQKYTCNICKIEQLLSIYYLWCVSRNVDSFYCFEIIPTGYGFGITNLNKFFFSDIINGSVKEDLQDIDDELKDVIIPPLFLTRYNEPSPYAKYLLLRIFRKFGNYSCQDLAQFLNEIKDNVISDNKFSLDNFNHLLDKHPNFPKDYNKVLSFVKDKSLDYYTFEDSFPCSVEKNKANSKILENSQVTKRNRLKFFKNKWRKEKTDK